MTNVMLEGRIALVTGASGGLGRHFARTLAAAGAKVAVTARRLPELESLVAEIESDGGEAIALRFDASDISAISATLDAIEARLGTVSILVNNAGIVEAEPTDEVTPEAFDAVFGLNVRGGFFLSQAVAARLMAAKIPGRIINIGSTLGRRQPLRAPIYSISKAAVFQMTRMLAHAWAHARINVNCIAPGMVRSDYNRDMITSEAGQKAIAEFPRKRVNEPDQLDGLLLYLASDASEIMTGGVFDIDDGQAIAR